MKAKSEHNFGYNSPRNNKKVELSKPEPFRDYNITHRINNLRTELSKELNHIKH